MLNKIIDIFVIYGMKRKEAIDFAVIFEHAPRYDRALLMDYILKGYADEDYTMADFRMFIDKIVELNPKEDRRKLRAKLNNAYKRDLFALGHNEKLLKKQSEGFHKRMEDLFAAAYV